MAEISIYIVSCRGSDVTVLLINGQTPQVVLNKTYINSMFAGARILYEHLVRPFSQEEWESMAYMYNNQFKNLLRHTTLYSFYFKGDLFVPAPNLDFAGELHPIPELAPLLQEALAKAAPCEASTEIDFVSFTQHSDPDYAAIHLQDYCMWSGVNEALYIGQFKQGLERWNSYYVPRGDVPNIDQMSNLKAIVISGAAYNMTQLELPWRKALLDLIVKAYRSNHVKVVGICLGHQATAVALGGEAGPNPSKEFIYTLESCSSECENFLGDYLVAEIHGQCVLKPPENVCVLHTSKTTVVESMYEAGKLLTTQGHPEFSSFFMRHFFNDRALNCGCITREVYDQANVTYSEQEVDSSKLIDKINHFLREFPTN